INFAKWGCRWSRWRSGDLENPQAAVRVVDYGGDVEIFVNRYTGWEASWRGARRNTSCWNWAAEQRRRCSTHIDKLDRTRTGFRDYRDPQDTILSDSARGRTGGQRYNRWSTWRVSVGVIGN